MAVDEEQDLQEEAVWGFNKIVSDVLIANFGDRLFSCIENLFTELDL